MAASISAHKMSEVVAIYPITPSSPMAEAADEFSAKETKNVFGSIPTVYEMQSEGGAVGAIHGAMQAGTLTTTFTASQGLLLMIPSMYKIAGEMLPTVFNVSARTLSTHALSIFGDHADVMTCRETGFALLASSDQQEIHDQAAIAMATSVRASLPFLHFFDGFRSSHEIGKVSLIPEETYQKLMPLDAVDAFRARALNPDKPVLKGTAMNPDIWFQAAEARNLIHDEVVDHYMAICKLFEQETGRSYVPFEYSGAADAETVFVVMGSGANVAEEAVTYFNEKMGKKTGVLKIRLYRPFSAKHFLSVLPKGVKNLVVLDRTKEPGSTGEPLYLDVVAALDNGLRTGQFTDRPRTLGGRYGLSSKEFTPSHLYAALRHVETVSPENWIHGFTVGINDDVSKRSLPIQEEVDTEKDDVRRLIFWGMGSDGTVGANKNSIKIIGDESDKFVQGHFVYDSKKAGGTTISHLRFSDHPIQSHYLITKPDFIAVHQKEYLAKYDLLTGLQKGGTVLLNCDWAPEEVFEKFNEADQKRLLDAQAKLFIIDANKIVEEMGMPGRINTTMQAAFFKITQILADEVYQNAVSKAIKKTYGKKGEKVVDLNIKSFTVGLESFQEVKLPTSLPGKASQPLTELKPLPGEESKAQILQNVVLPIMRLQGDSIPVSQVPIDGVFPTDTTKYEKRSIATHVPKWDDGLCIQCGVCAFVCPHAAIQTRVHDKSAIQLSDAEYKTLAMKGKEAGENDVFRVQVLPDDCTGCGVCVTACLGKSKDDPTVKAITLAPKYDVLEDLRKTEKEFLRLGPSPARLVNDKTVKAAMLAEPLFKFSGACPGCGETPYIKLITQLVGDRMVQANATGCSSIYGGTAPTVPYCQNEKGRGPAWASSLFEDNAEYGLGMRLSIEYLQANAWNLREQILTGDAPANVKDALNKIAPLAEQNKTEIYQISKAAVDEFLALTEGTTDGPIGELRKLSSYLTEIALFIVGGDGWAYDIGYGGLDHVIASGKNVNILVMDTEVYSNTGGQRSKATFIGGVAKFAAAGKELNKKDLGMMAMSYHSAYVASVNFGANLNQTLKAVREAIEFPGTSLIIGYSNCIEHGIPMSTGPTNAKLATDCGYWLLYRYDPRLLAEGKNPLQLDSKKINTELVQDYLRGQRRFKRLMDERPERAKTLFDEAGRFIENRYAYYQKLAEMNFDDWKRGE